MSKKGFHKCDLCSMKMTDKDPHRSCVRCLGLGHNPEHCGLCQSLQPQTLQIRQWRLQEFLREKERKERSSSVPPPLGGREGGEGEEDSEISSFHQVLGECSGDPVLRWEEAPG